MAEETTQSPGIPAHHQPVLPEQVRRQMAEAEAIRQQMTEPTPPSDASDAGATPPTPDSAPPPPSSAAPSPSGAPAAEDGDSWEQRYNSLRGRFESTQRSNQQMADRLAQLENTISAMQARGAEAPDPNAPPPAPPPKPQLVTDQERTDYGDELLTVMGKRAREEFSPEFEELGKRLKRLEGQVTGVGEVIGRTQVQGVYAGLNEHVPQWRDVNKSAEFKAWLEQPDIFSGRLRKDMLREAYDRHETGRVVAFFRGFMTEAAGLPSTDPSSPGQSAPHPNGNGSGKPSLEDFAAPGRARSAPQELPPDKPVYSTAWIAKFMADKRTGKWRGREAEAEEIERDIYRAQHEGRIQ